MTFKRSMIALVFVASVSFCAVADNIVPGSAVAANADIAVIQDTGVGITIVPANNLTVSDFVKGEIIVPLGTFKVTGDDAAVRILNPNASAPHCSIIYSTTNKNHFINICIDKPGSKFDANGIVYYKADAAKDYILRTADNGPWINGSTVGAGTYKLSMEVAKYTR